MRKSISISIRVSEEELDKFKEAARLEAYSSYSEFIRRTALILYKRENLLPNFGLKTMQTMALPTTSRAAVGIIIIRELRYYWTVNRLLFTLMKKMEYVLLFQGMATIKFQKLKKYLKQMHNHSC